MSKFNEILNLSDAGDDLLGAQIDALAERLDTLEESTGWIKPDLSKVISAKNDVTVTNDSNNRICFKKEGNVVYFDIRLALNCTSTTAVMVSLHNVVPPECVPNRSTVVFGRSGKFTNDDDYKCEQLGFQFNTHSSPTEWGILSLFYFNNTKFNNVNNFTSVIAKGSYHIDDPA